MTKSRFIAPFDIATYKSRRLQLIKSLEKQVKGDFTALFWSGSELVRNYDNHFPFRAHSDFLYLTGFAEPEVMMGLQSVRGKRSSWIALRARDLSPHRGSEIWEGERVGVERAPKALGFEESLDIRQIVSKLESDLPRTPHLLWTVNQFPEWDHKILDLLKNIGSKYRGICPVKSMIDPSPQLHSMRQSKSSLEIDMMRKTAQIGSAGHIRAMKITRPGMYEYEVASEVEREFKRLGAQSLAYGSIVGGGNNSCTLHYHSNNCELKPTDILLIDAGSELDGYASDITRSFPVASRFSDAQREAYSWVLKSQIASIRSVKPGSSFDRALDVSVRVLSEGLSSMGLFRLRGADVYKKGLWKRYMPHGIGHWLGLDVHDCGAYRSEKNPQKPFLFKPGNIITIEPGLYFHESDTKVPKKFRGIGIRIEDDVLVTRSGQDVLTKNCPKSIEEIESLRAIKL